MSSMFKKRGGLAFKPRIPSARRPTAPQPPKQTTEPIAADLHAADIPEVIEEIITEVDAPVLIEQVAATRSRRRSSVASSTKADELAAVVPAIRPEDTHKSVHISVEQPPDENDTQTQPPIRQTRAARHSSPPAETTTQEEAIVTIIEKPASIQTSSTPDATLPPVVIKPRQRRKSSAIVTEPSNETTNAAPATKPAKRSRKNPVSTDEAGAEPSAKRQASSMVNSEKPASRTLRRARSITPEDSENRTVDLQKLKMSDLTKDLHIGRKFSRHDELRERERQSRVRSKLEKGEGSELGDASRSSTPLAEQRKLKANTPNSSSSGAGPAPAGPQFRIVDGQIVVDQSSLVMDRHARAAAAHAGEDMETIEENDFTRLITSSSFMNTSKLRGPNIWTEQETEMFYRGLRMLGTDFEMIAQMIPGKQRRHVKLKFNREERHSPHLINAALIGEKTTKIDIEAYQAATGAEFEPVEAIEAEQRKIQESYESERQRVVDEQAEVMRKKREELFADEDGESKKKGTGRRKGKQVVEYGLNGEPIRTDS